MFKTVGRDHETTAAMQAEFLQSLFAQQGDVNRAESQPDLSTIDWSLLQSGIGTSPSTTLDPMTGQAPHIDITDFESWMSAFEVDALPMDSAELDGNAIQGAASMMPGSGGQILPSTSSTDWDAVSSALVSCCEYRSKRVRSSSRGSIPMYRLEDLSQAPTLRS